MEVSTRILLVEDDDDDVEITLARLNECAGHDFQVTVSTTLDDARRQLAETTFDAVMLDYRMPQGKGTELVREILELPTHPRLILCSGNEDSFLDKEAMAMMRQGTVRFLTKRSMSQEELIDLLIGAD